MDAASLPAPPTGHVQVCAEGHFGLHDPTRAPQFYDERTPHFAVFPTLPTDESDPYYPYRYMWQIPGEDDITWNIGGLSGVGLVKRQFFVRCRAAVRWANERANTYYDSERERDHPNTKYIHFLDMRLPRLKQFLSRLEFVSNNLTAIRIMMNGLFRLWLDVSASVDYMTMYQPVLRHERALHDLPTLPRTLGVFTSEHHVVEMFSLTPNVPVYYTRELDEFNTQRILKVVSLQDPPSYTAPPTPFPIIFSGPGDDPAKLGSQVRFLDRFLRFRSSAVGFTPLPPTITENAVSSSSSLGAQRSTSSLKAAREQAAKVHKKKAKPKDPNARNLFEDDVREPYAPPLHPGWRGINLELETEAVEERRRLQHQRREPLLTAKYMLPHPGLFLRSTLADNVLAVLLNQLHHIFDALIYRINSLQSEAPLLASKEWRDILFLPRQRELEDGQHATHRAEALAKTAASLGEALSSGGVSFLPVGRKWIWSLFEINFRYELIMLDDAVSDPKVMLSRIGADLDSPTEDEEGAAYEARYAEIVSIFPEESFLRIDPSQSCQGLCSKDWAPRAERLERLRRVMGMWPKVVKPAILKVPISAQESSQGLAQERALALLYAQTFYNTFERPAILPRAWL
ncbi:hypothetical protein BDZ89DRAFT_1073510 [Hymenopellis radicata]|nr:hypothetical protein BDZ89DRAFT_1073510 [Hymenopellis radicata]